MVDKLDIITKILLKYIGGDPLDEQERLRLQNWLDASPANLVLFGKMQKDQWLEDGLRSLYLVNKDKIWEDLQLKMKH